MQPLIKILISALLIFAVSEIAQRNSVVGALVASLPIVSIVAMIWLWRDTHDAARLARFSAGVFWLVIPSLVLFAFLPVLLLRCNFTFPVALAIACSATVLTYLAMLAALKTFGVQI
ncbi:MAG: DUF3147 family protein [Chthoniobacterales bacterium]|nr:DUF3147 family protein [Chthoniobacterales bacterium]